MTVIDLLHTLPIYEVPDPVAPPGIVGVDTLMSWFMYIVAILAIVAFVIVGVTMMYNNKHGQATEENMRKLTFALAGCIVVAAASGITGALIG